jgi:hypothetical protein
MHLSPVLLLLHVAAAKPSTVGADFFPARPEGAPTGTAFAKQIAGLSDHERYEAVLDQVLSGNVPDFLRELVPVTLTRPPEIHTGAAQVTVFVAPDYLSVGSDTDFLTVPLDFVTTSLAADALGFVLPTTRIVDAVYQAATLRLSPVPLPAGAQMRSVEYILEHRARIAAERGCRRVGDLVAGTKKDLVLTGRLRTAHDREAIYGWHRLNGKPIQPLSLVHGKTYADYSHGIRVVDDTVIVDGQPCSYLASLADPEIAPLLSREGPIPDAEALMHPTRTSR